MRKQSKRAQNKVLEKLRRMCGSQEGSKGLFHDRILSLKTKAKKIKTENLRRLSLEDCAFTVKNKQVCVYGGLEDARFQRGGQHENGKNLQTIVWPTKLVAIRLNMIDCQYG